MILIRQLILTYRKVIMLLYTAIARKRAGKVGEKLRVNHYSTVTRKTVLANNVNFNGFKILGGGVVTIGNNFHSGFGCIVMTTIHNYDNGNKIPYDETVIHRDVTIKDNVWFGINVTILPGVTIGEGAIIQAGSVVTSNIPACAIAGGHPAKVFKYRNKEHYFQLKNEAKFF